MAQEIVKTDPNEVPSLTLAFLGDSVFETAVRTVALEKHLGNVNEVNKYAKSFSNAVAQSKMSDLLQDVFTEKEIQIFKRGRNAKSVSAPHTCTIGEYRKATGLEALFGYLYLQGSTDRIRELITTGIEKLESAEIE